MGDRTLVFIEHTNLSSSLRMLASVIVRSVALIWLPLATTELDGCALVATGTDVDIVEFRRFLQGLLQRESSSRILKAVNRMRRNRGVEFRKCIEVQVPSIVAV